MSQAVCDTFQGVGLLRPTADVLAGCGLPPESEAFLLTAGLPQGNHCDFTFGLVRELPPVGVYAATRPGCPPVPEGLRSARCVGADGAFVMVIEPPSWHVRCVDLGGRLEDQFVNSSVQMFGACLAAYTSLWDVYRTLGATRAAAALDQRLREIDARAVQQHPQSWWSGLIQEFVDVGLA